MTRFFKQFIADRLYTGSFIKTISAVLGHSETSTTLNIYAHEVAAANARAVDVVGDIYNELLGKKKG